MLYQSFDKYFFPRVSLEIVHFAQICCQAYPHVQYIIPHHVAASIAITSSPS